MTINDLFKLLVCLCIAILLSCSIIVEAQQDSQDDYNTRSAEQRSQSSEYEARSSAQRTLEEISDSQSYSE